VESFPDDAAYGEACSFHPFLEQAVVTRPRPTQGTSSEAASTMAPTTTQSDNCAEVDTPHESYERLESVDLYRYSMPFDPSGIGLLDVRIRG
jgi:hypothetical protein